ncbi:disease resistance protein TAO1-like [Cryptomeria japonica]|uniref:disease resistance protein TAO1-like n=1 Tax=Cryptomeria japonica TaxID=3369 RepID=UPI0027DA5CA9|nr:disease resistance protein TAO1-like [Cryptomeria japonica]
MAEAETIEDSVSKSKRKREIDVLEHPVELDAEVSNFERSTLQKNVNIVGVLGMGGCGKTTLVNKIFIKRSSRFSGSSFLRDVGKAAKENSLHLLQKKILDDVLGTPNVFIFDDANQGKTILAHQLKNRRVLIVLDGIDDVKQLDVLMPEKNRLGSGSMVIVTTRDVGVLESYGIFSIYIMKGLDSLRAKELFCLHAFSQHQAMREIDYLDEKLSIACGGLPLSLQVLGGLHRQESKDVWSSRLDKIRDVLLSDATPILRVLVAKGDSLKGEYSNLTRDLQPTQLRELIVLGRIGKFPRSIGQLQQLQKVVVDEYLNTSLEALPEEFSNLQSLEHLTLRWCRALTTLRTNFGKLENLIHLDLAFNSGLKALPPSFKQLINLQYLDLQSCSNLEILPHFLGKITTLHYLNFRECRELKVLPSQVPCQLSLKSLNLSGTSIEEIPSEMGRLINLEVLNLGSPYLTSLPVSFCNLKNLQTLNLEGCSSLTCIPELLAEMTNLNIHITGCPKLKELSENS